MSAYLLKRTENAMKWDFFSSFLKEKTAIFSSSEQQMGEPCSAGQGQCDERFYATSKDVQAVESKLEMKSTS